MTEDLFRPHYIMPREGDRFDWEDERTMSYLDPLYKYLHYESKKRITFDFEDWIAQGAFFESQTKQVAVAIKSSLRSIPRDSQKHHKDKLTNSMEAMIDFIDDRATKAQKRGNWTNMDYWDYIIKANEFLFYRLTQFNIDREAKESGTYGDPDKWYW